MGPASGVLQAVQSEHNQQEIAWAARAWAEACGAAAARPRTEDIHWGEEPLLELIEHLDLGARRTAAPSQPGQAGVARHPAGVGRRQERATAIETEPLGADESEALIDALLDDDEPRRRRAPRCSKRPGRGTHSSSRRRSACFEANGSAVERIPDTLQALIAARIDHLPEGEKSVLQRAAVIGRTFWSSAVEHLGGDARRRARPLLDDLLLREFVLTEQRSTISGEEAYRSSTS